MKTYKRLYEKIDKESVLLAIKEASRGGKKKRRKDARLALQNTDEYADYILSELPDFKNDKHEPKEIYDGISRKKRTIIVPTFREQVVHHLMVDLLKPFFLQGIYEYAYGSIPNRGVHDAKKVIERWIRKDTENCKYPGPGTGGEHKERGRPFRRGLHHKDWRDLEGSDQGLQGEGGPPHHVRREGGRRPSEDPEG